MITAPRPPLAPRPAIDATIEEKVTWAEVCFQQLGHELLDDEAVADLLERLAAAIVRSSEAVRQAGIDRYCRRCDEQEGGSCCGAELENRYDPVLLLVNRLLGVRLPQSRRDERSCFFLGGDGCLLKARHVICVNYLCGAITNRIDFGDLCALRRQEGVQLDTLFRLHARIARLQPELARNLPE